MTFCTKLVIKWQIWVGSYTENIGIGLGSHGSCKKRPRTEMQQNTRKGSLGHSPGRPISAPEIGKVTSSTGTWSDLWLTERKNQPFTQAPFTRTGQDRYSSYRYSTGTHRTRNRVVSVALLDLQCKGFHTSIHTNRVIDLFTLAPWRSSLYSYLNLPLNLPRNLWNAWNVTNQTRILLK